jgi:hypothetical protein
MSMFMLLHNMLNLIFELFSLIMSYLVLFTVSSLRILKSHRPSLQRFLYLHGFFVCGFR